MRVAILPFQLQQTQVLPMYVNNVGIVEKVSFDQLTTTNMRNPDSDPPAHRHYGRTDFEQIMSTNRITEKQLQAIVERINRVTDSPMEPYANGRANIGHYHLSFAYGGVQLHRMVGEHGGVTCPLGNGHVPKRELAQRMWAFLSGLEAKAEVAA